MAQEPAVRARATIDLLNFLDQYSPGLKAKVRLRIPPETLALLESATAVEWISIEHTHFLIDGIVDTVGRENAPEVWASYVQKTLIKSQMIKTFVEASLRLFRTKPVNIIKMLPRAWNFTYRDFCNLRIVEVEAGRGVIALESIAPSVLTYSNYFIAFEGVFRGLAREYIGDDVTVTITIDAGNFSGLARMTWRERD